MATYISDRTQGRIRVSAPQVSHVDGPFEWNDKRDILHGTLEE